MKNIAPKTLEEHRNYLHEIVKLKLFWMHLWLEDHPEETFSHVLRERVDIYRKTDANTGELNPAELFFDDAPWMSMETAAEKIYNATKNDRAAFEKEAFEVFRPSLDARCERDFLDRSSIGKYQCGSLRHELKLNWNNPVPTLGFHIANAIAPHSIFEDPKYLKCCFMLLLQVAEQIYGAEEISTSTWLNQHSEWLKFFPQEWLDNMQPAITDNVFWHYGFWGQFISARGTFNEKYGKFVRENRGRFPHYPAYSHCSVKAMREHLNRMF